MVCFGGDAKMALFRKKFYREPPEEGLLEIHERVFVFRCCFTNIEHIMGRLRECYPDASFMVHNPGDENHQIQITNLLSEYGVNVVNYPHRYKKSKLLPSETIHHFLSTSVDWLSAGQRNVILMMHCGNSDFPFLAFVLAAFLIFSKRYSDERKTLEFFSPVNPLPSQLRYLEYVSRSVIDLEWPPTDRTAKLIFTPPKEIVIRYFEKADCEHGCITLDDDDNNPRHEENDTLWNVKDRFPKDLRAEVLFSGTKGRKTLHIEECDKYSDLDSEASETSNALDTIENVAKLSTNDTISPSATSKSYTISDYTTNKTEPTTEPSELQVSVQRPAQSKIIMARIPQTSPNSNSPQVSSGPLSRYRSPTSAVGITALLHDHDEISNQEARSPLTSPELSISATTPRLLKPMQPTNLSVSPQHYINSKSEIIKSPPPPPPPPPLLSSAPPPPLPSSTPPPPPPLPSSAPPPPPPPQRRDPRLAFAVPPPPPPQRVCSASSPARIRQVVPPPPAPFGANKGKLQSRTSTKIQAQTKKTPLKPYHWLKLTRAMQGSLWAEAQKTDDLSTVLELDMPELESLFSTTIPNTGHCGKTNRRGSGFKTDKKVHLIELRRAYNCEIMLTKVKVPLSDLMASVLALDDSALDIDQVDNLIKFCPTKEEIQLLKNYTGEKNNLGKCEQFFLELIKVPRVESKLRVFSFKIQFLSQVSDLRNSLNIVNSASIEIRNSVKLKRIMQAILSLGNALNYGTARGSAVGFRLDSLLKLSETRSRNNKLTLIHYLCKVLSEKLPDVMNFHEDLANLEAATKIQLKYLAEEMQAISKGLEKVVQELTASENDGGVSLHFCKTLNEFYGSAEAEVRSLASVYSIVGRNADALAIYFGEDPARCPFEQVVSTLLNFVRMFRRAHEENCKQLEFEKKRAQREAENAKDKTNAFRKELEMS